MHKTIEGMADVTVEQATQGQWVSWLGFTFIPAYLEATLKPVQVLSDMHIYIHIYTHSYIHMCICVYICVCMCVYRHVSETCTNVITK